MSDLELLRDSMRMFTDERDWGRFHDPKSLLLALVGEVGELSELFQWLPAADAAGAAQQEPLRTRVGEELADVLLYLVRLADVLGVDLTAAAEAKMLANADKHRIPVGPEMQGAAELAQALGDVPILLSEASQILPSSPGLYAAWARSGDVPGVVGPVNGADPEWSLMYVGLASNLRSRVVGNHMRRSGSSTLRRVLAAVLMEQEGFTTRFTDRVVLVDEDEVRLTSWMERYLRLTWVETPCPEKHEKAVIGLMRPPLNVDHAEPGNTLTRVKAARKAYRESAGPRPSPDGAS